MQRLPFPQLVAQRYHHGKFQAALSGLVQNDVPDEHMLLLTKTYTSLSSPRHASPPENFLLEMGHGFCFEAKQKRILIGDEWFFIDLVFYHRVLKCHVLVELKVDEAKHEHIGQLKTYVNYFKKEVMQEDDNPPVGILLVTNQNKALVEYAIADSDQQLFVSKYLLELPSKKDLIAAIEREKNVLREQGIVYGVEHLLINILTLITRSHVADKPIRLEPVFLTIFPTFVTNVKAGIFS